MSKATAALEQLRDMPDEELRQALDRTRDEAFRMQLGKYTNDDLHNVLAYLHTLK